MFKSPFDRMHYEWYLDWYLTDDSKFSDLSEEEQELRLKLTIANIQNGRSPEEYEKDIDTAIMMDKFRKSFDSEEAFQEYVKNVQDSMKETAVVEEVVNPTKKRK